MVACYRGFGTIVALLGCCPFLDVNQQDKDGNTALMLAAQAGARHPHPNQHPLSRPPTPSHPCSQPSGPQPQTLHKGSLWPGFIVRPFTWESVLWSCLSGHMTLVTLLLNYFAGLDLERRDQRGLTALMKAAIRDRSDCVAALLMAGVWLHALRYHPTRHH